MVKSNDKQVKIHCKLIKITFTLVNINRTFNS